MSAIPSSQHDAPVKVPAHHECNIEGCGCNTKRTMMTWPNLVTLVRTLVCVGLALYGASIQESIYLLIGLGIYWVGDVLDGALARAIKQETILGGVFDIVSDRACCSAFYISWIAIYPEFWFAIMIYFVNFMIFDMLLSLSFLNWPLRSVNYLYVVSPVVYKYNFSPIAKGLNSALFLVVLLWLQSPITAAVLASVLMIVKIISVIHIQRQISQLPRKCLGDNDV